MGNQSDQNTDEEVTRDNEDDEDVETRPDNTGDNEEKVAPYGS